MNSNIQRILLLLANSRISPAELREFQRWLFQSEPQTLSGAVSDVRRLLDKLGSELFQTRTTYSKDYQYLELAPKKYRATIVDPIDRSGTATGMQASHIRRLLLDESGLKSSDAARMLMLGLRRRGVSPSAFPVFNKKNFEAWLDKVMRTVSPKLVEAEARRIREQSAHGDAASDWSLRAK